ncbi:competence protein ComEC [Arthrobacter pascens]|uniref:ComEC/Rec2 family competence protein n=1 Tax=Arthrobacter pascens TaxID=1677 RepID=UPI0028566C48|nr:ComEC/Rec2 family competence protein [Arthrobacter pascens]MDR6556694.1 competence protein ComEC [Arthrobacter pascens]
MPLHRSRELIRSRLFPEERADSLAEGKRRRVDLRLIPPALLVWAAAGAGPWISPAWLLGLCCAIAAGAACLVVIVLRRHRPDGRAGRSFLLTMAAAMLLAAAAAAHSAVSSAQKHDGPVAAAIAARAPCLAEVEIAGAPRALTSQGGSDLSSRWAVDATITSLSTGGRLLRAEAPVVILGGADWQHVVQGQRVRAAGNLRPPAPGQVEAGILAASAAPIALEQASALTSGPASLGRQFSSAAGWLDADARGLLPGMVAGDTSGLDDQLEIAMQTVGLTHLTAVSGANCSLILGALLLAARSLRLGRLPAAALALAGLGLFVLMVGPDASVLRASLMGAIALASLAGGRGGRGLSFLCLAVIGLLLIDPGLGTSFGFLLSVLATLGIIVLGRQIVSWIPRVIPRWIAAAFAVPLSAQLLCGPVIVLLQPQFATYSLLANLLAAPLVAPVTILGTAAVPLVPLLPWLAAPLISAAGLFAAGVAGVARFMAGLPGAAPPWPEGPFGLFTMVLFSVLNVLLVWLAASPARTVGLVFAAHGAIAETLERVLPATSRLPGPSRLRRPAARGLVQRVRRRRLRVCNTYPGRNLEWPLPRPNDSGRRVRYSADAPRHCRTIPEPVLGDGGHRGPSNRTGQAAPAGLSEAAEPAGHQQLGTPGTDPRR